MKKISQVFYQIGGLAALILLGIGLIFLFLWVVYSIARIELVTVPVRESVGITIDRNNNALVQEIRTVTVKEGANVVQFDWSNMNIDMDTVQVQILEGAESVIFGSMSIPPGSKNAPKTTNSDPDLDKVIVAWLDLPKHIK